MANFAVIGVAGFVAPRHLQAIRDTGNVLLAATDPNDSVGILDRFSFDTRFFQEIERFDRFLEKARRGPESGRVDYLSICSPNYLHDAHVRLALRCGADAICEKPLVINPWNLDALQELEGETGRSIRTVLQLRLHPELIALRERVQRDGRRHQVTLTYLTARGAWYLSSWKGSEERSGGLAANIGVHFFDLLYWLFGPMEKCEVHLRNPQRMAGSLQLQRADVRWFLSVNPRDLAAHPGKRTFRALAIDGKEVDFNDGFADLHTRVYEEILSGRGFGIDEARPSIEMVSRVREAVVRRNPEQEHPMLDQGV